MLEGNCTGACSKDDFAVRKSKGEWQAGLRRMNTTRWRVMRELRRLWVAIPAVVLVALLVVLFLNRGTLEQLAFLRQHQGQVSGLVDQRPYQTAQTLAALAVSSEEQTLAQQAERLADHEVDQAFAMALRVSQQKAAQRTLTGEAADLQKRVDALKPLVKDDQAKVDTLTAAAKAPNTVAAAGDDLDVAQAQLALDQDELTDATADLARTTGDKRGQIQQELAAHEAAMKKNEESGGGKKQPAVITARQFAALAGRLHGWFAQRSRAALLQQAETQASADAKQLQAQHAEFEKHEDEAGGSALDTLTGSSRVRQLQAMSTRRVVMSILDDRVATDQQLASTYGSWQRQVWVQHHLVGYLLLQSFAWIALIVLLTSVGATLGKSAVRRVGTEPRQIHTLETIVVLAVELCGLLAVALVVFGVPQQMPTIVGFATAGITVVFQDFILGFFGWFSLMSKHGIRVGDWVEINSVSGEVAEISLFRTVLLETGNWTTLGHPTGRRMSFSNSFALRGQYFNFSTNGQWMWDEVSMNVPTTVNAVNLIQQMQAAVAKETEQDTEQAGQEWQRVTKDIGLGQFSAKPTVELRPSASGVDVVVRFVTRASDRFGMRNRINAALLATLESARKTEGAEAK